MLLRKFSLMDPNEFDRYEDLQQSKFRPASLKDVPQISKNLFEMIKSKKKISSGSTKKLAFFILFFLLYSISYFNFYKI